MANYKVVDADQLDADLESVANMIRSKTDRQERLAFPNEFVSEIEGIEVGGGVELPTLANPATGADIVAGKEAIDKNGNVIEGTVRVVDSEYFGVNCDAYQFDNDICMEHSIEEDVLIQAGSGIILASPGRAFGDAAPEDVVAGKTFTSVSGVMQVGTAQSGGAETCVVHLIDDYGAGLGEVYYVDENGNLKLEYLSEYFSDGRMDLVVLKNSAIFFGDCAGYVDITRTTVPFHETLMDYGYPIFHVAEDGVICFGSGTYSGRATEVDYQAALREMGVDV